MVPTIDIGEKHTVTSLLQGTEEMYPMSVVPTLVCDDKFDGFHLHSVGAYQNNTFNGDPTIQLLIDIQGQGGGVREHTPQC